MFVRKSSFFGNAPAPVTGHDYLNEGSRTDLQCKSLSINDSPLQPSTQKIASSAHVVWTALFAILAFVSVAATAGRGFQLSAATTKAPGDGKPQLSVSFASLTFDPVAVGARSSKALTLSNTGSTTLIVSALKVSGSGFTVTGGTFPMSMREIPL